MMHLAAFLGVGVSFYDICQRESLLTFLNSKIKPTEQDPEKKWITTWNDYLWRIKFFFRWLHNCKSCSDPAEEVQIENWKTPSFVQIKKKRTKRLSPYAESEIWDLEEILLIVKYEHSTRNRAALTLFWDLDARNHEVTKLKIKHIRLRENYGEGEIPYDTKTGGGPILLTCSFPYVRDWLNEHPLGNSPNAFLICNQRTGGSLQPDAMWSMMMTLRKRISRFVTKGVICDSVEKGKIQNLLNSKRWNPYCIRHSAITHDSDYLPEYALKKKARWSMNSKQGSRYIKRRMGNQLKQQILAHNGIIATEVSAGQKQVVRHCYRCGMTNAFGAMYCSKCGYPLTQEALQLAKDDERKELQNWKLQYDKDIEGVRQEVEAKFEKVLELVRENPKFALIKPEVLLERVHEAQCRKEEKSERG